SRRARARRQGVPSTRLRAAGRPVFVVNTIPNQGAFRVPVPSQDRPSSPIAGGGGPIPFGLGQLRGHPVAARDVVWSLPPVRRTSHEFSPLRANGPAVVDGGPPTEGAAPPAARGRGARTPPDALGTTGERPAAGLWRAERQRRQDHPRPAI